MTAFIQLRFYDQDPFAAPDGTASFDPVAVERSEARFQLVHALDDLGLHVARVRPDLPPGRYPVDLSWTREGTDKGMRYPVLSVRLPGDERVDRIYPYLSLRCAEVLARLSRQRPELLAPDGKKLFCVAAPADETASRARRGAFVLEELDDEPDLSVTVQEFPQANAHLAIDTLPQLGCEWAVDGTLPATCPEHVLRSLLREVAEDCSTPFSETGWYLLGRVVRNGAEGDLVLRIEDAVRARETVSTAGSVVFSEETKIAVAEEVRDRAQRSGDPGLRVVGWVHTHDIGAVIEARNKSRADGETVGERADEDPADGRFFSLHDEVLHRKDFPAASVALVIDAPAARRDSDIERCVGVFGAISGVILRRGLSLVTDAARDPVEGSTGPCTAQQTT
jgi:hypothetical protein